MRFKALLVLAPAFPDEFDMPIEGIFVKEQLNYLKKYFFEVNVIAPHTPWRKYLQKKDRVDYQWDNVRVHYPMILNLPVPYVPDLWKENWVKRESKKITEFIRSRDIHFDLIHAHFTWYSGAVAVELKREFGIPLVITEHTSIALDQALKIRDPLYVDTWSACDAIIRVSSSDIQRIKEFNANTKYIPNGFDEEKFYPMEQRRCRDELNLSADSKIILSVGNLVDVKGHKYLISSIKNILKVRDDISCIIIGSGPLKNDLNKLIKKHKLDGHIRLEGAIAHDRIPLFMNACDLFVLPSLSEGNPTVMFEALGCGKPFVGTKVGGEPGVITSDDFGYLVEPANSAELGEKILKAMEKEWSWERIVEYSRTFTWRSIADDIRSVYSEL